MARPSKYLIALSKQIAEEMKVLETLSAEFRAKVSAQEGKVDALVSMRTDFEKLGRPKKKAAPLKAVAAAQS